LEIMNTASCGVREISWASDHGTCPNERKSLQNRRSASRSENS
jgi:hypothetical protein